jgi:hypothetical protein
MSQLSGGNPKPQVMIPFREPRADAPPVTAVRGMLLVSSLQALRACGKYDEYLKRLPAELHEPILTAVAGATVELSIATRHYQTCDSLGLTPEEVQQNGKRVGEKVNASMLATAAALARGAGVTPWVGLQAMSKLWARLFDGGNLCILKVGPKDARVIVEKVSLARIAYFRHSFIGVNYVGFELFTRRVVVQDRYSPKTPEVLEYQASWV